MRNKLILFYESHARQESMLLSMAYTFIFVEIGFVLVSLDLEEIQNSVLHLVTLFFAFLLLKRFYYTHSVRRTAILFIMLMELCSGVALLVNSTQHFIAISPLIFVGIFFFFLSLREAIRATLLHLLYWALLVKTITHFSPYTHTLLSANIINELTAMMILFFLGIFYQLSTESAYRKLEDVTRKRKKLLKEIHNKIKNNLNFISSILGLQQRYLQKYPKEEDDHILIDTKQRIETIALAHRDICKGSRLGKIDFSLYIQNLVELIRNNFQRKIGLQMDITDVNLSESSTHRLGLIINELLTHTLKQSDKKLTVVIAVSKEGYSYRLYYQDNMFDLPIQNTFGSKLIDLIVRQMEAEITPVKEPGSFEMRFDDDH